MPDTGWARPKTARAWHWFSRTRRGDWFRAGCATKSSAWEMPPESDLVEFSEAGGYCCEKCFVAYSRHRTAAECDGEVAP